MAATAEAVAELGYGATTVAAIVERARVSRKTFYEQFADKEEAFLAAYEAIEKVIEVLTAAAGQAGGDAEPSDARRMVRSAVGAYLSALASEPALTRMLVIEAVAAGPRVLERRRAAFGEIADALAAPLAAARRRDPALPAVGRTMLIALLGAVNELCLQHITAQGPETLSSIAPDVERVALRICFGEP